MIHRLLRRLEERCQLAWIVDERAWGHWITDHDGSFLPRLFGHGGMGFGVFLLLEEDIFTRRDGGMWDVV